MKMYRLMEVLQEMIEEETNYLNSSDPANDPIYFESAERKNALEICLNAFQLACAAHNTKEMAVLIQGQLSFALLPIDFTYYN